MMADRVVPRSARHACALAVAVLAVAAIGLLAALGALAPGVLMLLPALLLTLVLVAGRYPGERLLERWRRARPRVRRALATVLAPGRRPPQLVRGGRLIAAALAGRAPPVFVAG
jgi:fatty acid desaturase